MTLSTPAFVFAGLVWKFPGLFILPRFFEIALENVPPPVLGMWTKATRGSAEAPPAAGDVGVSEIGSPTSGAR
jgi:hypothetical protein